VISPAVLGLVLLGSGPEPGLELLRRGDLAAAIAAFEREAKADPLSPIPHRDRAMALLRADRLDEAQVALQRAIDLGDVDPEVDELAALILARRGEGATAVDAANRAGSWEGDLIAAALGDAGAASRASGWTAEVSDRGALSALVLAAHAGSRGERTSARNLSELSRRLAERRRAEEIELAADSLVERLGGGGEFLRAGAWLRAGFDWSTNPGLIARTAPTVPSGLRSVLSGEAQVQAPIGTARLDAALRFDQHLYLTRRDRFSELDITGFTVAASVEIPISDSPDAALVGLAVRFRDLWGERFDVHYASAFEAGPTLVLPFDLGTRLVLGVFGTGEDFIDRSPRDAEVSSQNRDRIGQRAWAALIHRAEWYEGRVEAAFIRDDAYGEAFDVRGGAVAAHGRAELWWEGWWLRAGAAIALRRYGPIGDPNVLGSAAFRAEARTVIHGGLSIPLADHLHLVADEVWIRTTARSGHAYTDNVLSIAVETSW
jgi:hypothetical protein